MPDASFIQDSFMGGEWGPFSQGRVSHPKYKTAMALSRNGIPIEEGAWERRSGTAFICHTRNGAYGRTLPFNFTDYAPYKVELTNGKLRVITGRNLVINTDLVLVVGISADSPAVFSVLAGVSWTTGQQIIFQFNSVSDPSQCAILRNRQFTLTMLNSFQFTLTDPITGAAVNGPDVNFVASKATLQACRILEFTTPYTQAQLPAVRKVQAANIGPQSLNCLVMLHPKVQPQILEGTAYTTTAANLAGFTYSALDFSDGPYLDSPVGSIMTPNGLGPNNVQFTLTYQTWLSTSAYNLGDFVTFSGLAYQSLVDSNLNNQPDTHPSQWQAVNVGGAAGPNGFQQTDVGRSIRFLSEPAQWAIGTPYSVGTAAKYNGAYYICISANTGFNPVDNLTMWQPSTSPNTATWTWGKIVSVSAANVIVVDLVSGPVLYTQAINTWRLGAFSNTTGWPTCGTFHEGRLWLAGALPNRIDGSVANDIFNFAPTALDGTVGDANAVTAVFNDDELDEAFWISQNSQGLSIGTKSGEWLVRASGNDDPITPTSIQAKKHTKAGCANVEPVRTPLTTVFVHRYQRMLFELFPDVFSGKMQAPVLNLFAKHLSSGKIAQIAYQHELAPCLWVRTADGKLHGCTYRRKSAFANEEPDFVGFHRHDLGSGRNIIDIAVNPSPDQTIDTLTMVTQDPTSGVCHIEEMVALMDVNDPITNCWLVDDAVTPSGIVTSATGVTLYGLWHLNGKTVSAVIGGLDCGDHAVANGSMFVPYQSDPGGLFTLTYLNSLSAGSYGGLATSLAQVSTTTPGGTQNFLLQEWPLPLDTVAGNPSMYCVDWANAMAYGVCPDGLRAVNLVSGVQQYDANYITKGINTGQFPGFLHATPVITLDGYMIGQENGAANADRLLKVRLSDFSLVGQFGTSSAQLQPDNNTFTLTWTLVPAYAGAHYVWDVCSTSAFSVGLALLNSDTMQAQAITGGTTQWYLALSEPNAIGCAAIQSSLGGTAYFIGSVHGSNITSTHLYEGSINPGVNPQTGASSPVAKVRVVAQILPSQIDTTWFSFQNIYGICYDQTDGNLLAFFVTNDPTALHPYYLVKLNAITGAIMWKTAVAEYLGDSLGLKQMRTTGGVLAWIGSAGGGNATVYVVQTATGQLTTYAVSHLAAGFSDMQQTFDSLTGSLIVLCNSYQTGGNISTLTGGVNNYVGFGKLTGGGIFLGTSSTTISGGLPGVVGYTFMSQGQLLRTLLPQEAGMANGAGLGKTTRKHMLGVLLAATITAAVSFGTIFTNLRGAYFKSKGGIAYDTKTLFTGVYWHTLEDNYSFESQLCWQISRPLPATICAITGFGNTQDR